MVGIAELIEIASNNDSDIILFGYGPNPGDVNELERQLLEKHDLLRYRVETIQGRVKEAASEALLQLEGKGKHFIVYFDVDVIDFVDFPIADVPQFNTGLTFQKAMACLEVFTSSPLFRGLVITEFNPDHTDEDGSLATTFVQKIVQALAQK